MTKEREQWEADRKAWQKIFCMTNSKQRKEAIRLRAVETLKIRQALAAAQQQAEPR